MPKGHNVGCGWLGELPDGTEMLFPTEAEYLEAYHETLEAEGVA